MDKLRAITIFRRVIELGSFKDAAEDLNLSKAAISKNINELETYLKSPLINRTTRKMHITEAGELYYNQIRTILDELANADLSITESTCQLTGLLRVSLPMSVGLTVINPAICKFMNLYPEVKIEIIMSDQYIDLLEQGVDVSIRGFGKLENSSLKSRKIMDIERVICASPNYLKRASPLTTIEDIDSHNCLIYSLSSSPTSWIFRNEDNVRIINLGQSSFKANNSIALKQAALSDLGIVLIPKVLVKSELETGKLIKLLPDWKADPHSLNAIYPYHREMSRKLRTFIDFLVSYFSP